MTDPFGAITVYQYDDDNRLTKVSLKASRSAAETTMASMPTPAAFLTKILTVTE